jgi:hypothetical protein
MGDEELRAFASFALAQHDPAQQEDNRYQRCEHCHYTRHPCDPFDLAFHVLALLDRLKT